MQMSRKAGLAKKIAHTLMAMSIVYSSGINIVVNEVYAAEKILLEAVLLILLPVRSRLSLIVKFII